MIKIQCFTLDSLEGDQSSEKGTNQLSLNNFIEPHRNLVGYCMFDLRHIQPPPVKEKWYSYWLVLFIMM